MTTRGISANGQGNSAANVNFTQSGTGAVTRTVQSKERDTVSVFDFLTAAQIADVQAGTALVDCAAGIQAALNTLKNVNFPYGTYRIESSLTVAGQTVSGLGGRNRYNQTQITVIGNIPCFIPLGSDLNTMTIENFYVFYSATRPTTSVGNSAKIGFDFQNATYFLQFSTFRNCTVEGAWRCYYNSGSGGNGAYQTVLRNIFSFKCYYGFRHEKGTTMEFDTCFAEQGKEGFYLKDTLSATLINCAVDTMANETAGTAINYFENIKGISIVGWDAESNTIVGAESSYMRFLNCTGSVSGYVGYLNTISTAAAESAYMFLNDASIMTYTGCQVARTVATDWVFNGTAGFPITIASVTSSNVTVIGSNFIKPAGGTPTTAYNSYASGGSIAFYMQSSFGTPNLATYQVYTEDGVMSGITGGSFTVVGGSGLLVTGAYSRQGKTVTMSIQVNPNGGTVACVAGTSIINNLGFTPAYRSTCTACDANINSYGVGAVFTSGSIYPPVWAATANIVTITAIFLVA